MGTKAVFNKESNLFSFSLDQIKKLHYKKIILSTLLFLFLYKPLKSFYLVFKVYFFSSNTIPFILHKKMEVIINPYFRLGVEMHLFSSILILFLGSTLICMAIWRKFGKVHKTLGFIYYFLLFGFAIPGAILLTPFSFGSSISQLMFYTLVAIWFYSGIQSLRAIVKRDISAHKSWILLNFSITLSAPLQRWLIRSYEHYVNSPLFEKFGNIFNYDLFTSLSFILPFLVYFLFIKKVNRLLIRN